MWLIISMYACIVLTVQGEMTVDVEYVMLKNRIVSLEVETSFIRSYMQKMDERMANLETLMKSQPWADINNAKDQGDTFDSAGVGREKETLLNAFVSEKQVIRNALEEYEDQFNQMKMVFFDQIAALNESIATSKVYLERRTEATEDSLNNSLTMLTETVIDNAKVTESRIDAIQTSLFVVQFDFGRVDNKIAALEDSLNNSVTMLTETMTHNTANDKTTQSKIDKIETSVRAVKADLNKQSNVVKRDVKSMKSSIRSMGKRLGFIEEKRVGFTARLTRHLSKYKKDKIIVFDTVTANYGSGYDSKTGEFTAPVSGLYLLQFNVEAYDSEKAYAALFIRGSWHALAVVSEGPDLSGSNVAVAHMNVGDTACIKTANIGDPTYGIAAHRTSFSGVLIH